MYGRFSHLIFPSVCKESGLDPSFINFILASQRSIFSPDTSKPNFQTTQLITVNVLHQINLGTSPMIRQNLIRGGVPEMAS